ncbi:MAG: metalloregulator ArsR/SmtB family transcription factor [Candidatus Anstonellaceae archaeon]
MNKAAKIFAALAEPTRLQILLQLSKRSGCVSALQLQLKRSQPNISQHLRVLREAGLVKSRREGKKVCYSLPSRAIAKLISAAAKLGGR